METAVGLDALRCQNEQPKYFALWADERRSSCGLRIPGAYSDRFRQLFKRKTIVVEIIVGTATHRCLLPDETRNSSLTYSRFSIRSLPLPEPLCPIIT